MSLPEIIFDIDRNGLSLALVRLDELKVEDSKAEWAKYEESLFERIRSSVSLDDIKDDKVFRSYRDLYWTFGMDPTKLRVSSEALLRRIVNGQNLWRISNIVDVVNVASPMHKIPIGLVDVDKVVGVLKVRIAKPGEIFLRIGGGRKVCRGREIVLADDEKIVCFGYATHDSEETKVTNESSQIYILLYGAPAVSLEYLESAAQDTLAMVNEWVNCKPGKLRFYQSYKL